MQIITEVDEKVQIENMRIKSYDLFKTSFINKCSTFNNNNYQFFLLHKLNTGLAVSLHGKLIL